MINQEITTKKSSDQPLLLFENNDHKLRSKDIRYINLVMVFAKYIEIETAAIKWYFDETRSINVAKRLLAENNWKSIENVTMEDFSIWFRNELGDMKNVLRKMLTEVS